MNAAADDRVSGVGTPLWRIVVGAVVLTVLAWIGILLVPVYLHGFELARLLRTTHIGSEDAARQFVLDRGRSLGLSISPNQLQLRRVPGSAAVEVRYVVLASVPLYTINLHFSSTIAEVR